MAKEKEEKLKEEEVLETPKAEAALESQLDEVIEAVETVSAEETEAEAEPKTADSSSESEDFPKTEVVTPEGGDDEAVTVKSVKFASFEEVGKTQGETNKNLEILMDVKLQLTVELGRTELPIKKVLELTRGSIIELEKVAGEPVELYANGKLVAHGEVVVIEDNFGLRITSITEPEDSPTLIVVP